MVYTKNTWVDDDPTKPLSAGRLNHLETQYDEAVALLSGSVFANVKLVGGAKGDGVTDDTVAIQNTINSLATFGGGTVYFPRGVYCFDGYKGSQTAYSNSIRGGFQVPSGITLRGESEQSVRLVNIADGSTAAISIRGGDRIGIFDLTIDMDWPNKTAANLSDSSTRSEGIIFWNGTSTASNVRIGNVTVQNTGHYGIGVQNVAVNGLEIYNYTARNIGGDAIDIKDYVGYPKIGITLDNCLADTVGLNATAAQQEQDAAAFDLRGDVLATNLRVINLNSYNEPDTGNPMLGVCGVRINGALASNENRLGGRKARVVGVTITSNRAAGEGSETVKRIIGVRIGDNYASVVGAVVENCYVGFRTTITGDSTPLGVNVEGQAINCVIGLSVTSGCNNGMYRIVVDNATTGVDIPAGISNCQINAVVTNATTAFNIPAANLNTNLIVTMPPILGASYANDAAAAAAGVPVGASYRNGGASVIRVA